MFNAIQDEKNELLIRDARLSATLYLTEFTLIAREEVEALVNMGFNVFFSNCPRTGALLFVAAYACPTARPSLNWDYFINTDTGLIVAAPLLFN